MAWCSCVAGRLSHCGTEPPKFFLAQGITRLLLICGPLDVSSPKWPLVNLSSRATLRLMKSFEFSGKFNPLLSKRVAWSQIAEFSAHPTKTYGPESGACPITSLPFLNGTPSNWQMSSRDLRPMGLTWLPRLWSMILLTEFQVWIRVSWELRWANPLFFSFLKNSQTRTSTPLLWHGQSLRRINPRTIYPLFSKSLSGILFLALFITQ